MTFCGTGEHIICNFVGMLAVVLWACWWSFCRYADRRTGNLMYVVLWDSVYHFVSLLSVILLVCFLSFSGPVFFRRFQFSDLYQSVLL